MFSKGCVNLNCTNLQERVRFSISSSCKKLETFDLSKHPILMFQGWFVKENKTTGQWHDLCISLRVVQAFHMLLMCQVLRICWTSSNLAKLWKPQRFLNPIKITSQVVPCFRDRPASLADMLLAENSCGDRPKHSSWSVMRVRRNLCLVHKSNLKFKLCFMFEMTF